MPSTLVAAYLGVIGREAAGAQAVADLEARLGVLCARGRAAHPDVILDDESFVAHLARCGAPVAGEPERVHAEDLFVACAALRGDAGAVASLRAAHRPVVAGYLRRIQGSTPFIDEVEQRLWDGALVGKADVPPKLATYSGEGPLAGWLGISAQRIALMLLRHEGAEARAQGGAAAEVGFVAQDPELAFVKGKLRDAFQQALSRALGVLGDRERMIYRMHIVDGLSLERIAAAYGVSQSTVSRWLAAARSEVMAEAQRVLREDLRVSAEDFESIAGLMVSQLDLSVSRILKRP